KRGTAQEAKSPAELITLIGKADADTNKIKYLLQLGHSHIAKPGELSHDLDTAIILAQEAEKLSERLKYQKGLADSYVEKYHALREKQDVAEAKEYAQRAIKIYKEINSPVLYGDMCHNLGTCYSIDDSKELKERIRLEH